MRLGRVAVGLACGLYAAPAHPAEPAATEAPASELAATGGDGVTVRGRRAPAGQTRHTLDRETLTTVAGTGGDPLRALMLMPGFGRVPYGFGALVVRGARDGASAVFIDGLRVPNVFHFGFGPSVIAPEMIERIDYYPGNFPVRYGQLTGGVVDVTLRPASAEHWRGAAEIDMADAGVFAQGPLGEDTTVSLSVRRSYVDAVLLAGAELIDLQDATNVVPRYWDYQARLDHRPAPGTDVSVMLFGSDDEIRILDDDDSNGGRTRRSAETVTRRQHYDRLKGTWRHRLAAGTTLTLSPALGRDTASASDAGEDEEGNETAGQPDERLEYSFRGELRRAAERTWGGVFGFEYFTQAPGRLRVDRGRPLLRAADGTWQRAPTARERIDVGVASPYVEATGRFPFGLSVTPALRGDVYLVERADDPSATTDPRLTVRQTLVTAPGGHDAVLTLKAALGRFSQLPPNLQTAGPDGRLRLEPVRAWHYGLGLEWLADAHTSVDADVYLVRRQGPPRTRFALGVDAAGGPYAADTTRIPQARTHGFELMLRRLPGARVSGWISYSLAASDERDARGEPWARVRWDATHRLTTAWTLKLPSGITVGLTGQLATGYLHGVAGGTLSPLSGLFEPVPDPHDDDLRMPLHHQIDLRLAKAWQTSPDSTLEGYVDLYNVGNVANTEGWDWDYRYAAPRPLRGLPVFPALGLKWSVQ